MGHRPFEAANKTTREASAAGVSYNYDSECSADNLLNPDLSQRWIQGFLAANGTLLKVEQPCSPA